MLSIGSQDYYVSFLVLNVSDNYLDKIKVFDFHAGGNNNVMQMIKNKNLMQATCCDNIPGKIIRIV